MTVLPLPHPRSLPAISPPTLAEAAETYVADRDLRPASQRVYRVRLDRLVADVGADTPLGDITGEQLRRHVATAYGTASARTWNHGVAILRGLCSHAVRQGWLSSSPADALDRRRERIGREVHDKTRAIPEAEVRAFLERREHPIREKTLWALLYESAARASEVLGLDIADLDLDQKRGRITGKGGNAEEIAWETATARLLPRLLGSRRQGPVFLAELRPAPARQPASPDLDPDSGRARLSYRQAAALFTTASRGWTLHQLRHSRLSALAGRGLDVTLLRALSRHRSLRTLEIYARPSLDAAAAAAARFDPAARRGR